MSLRDPRATVRPAGTGGTGAVGTGGVGTGGVGTGADGGTPWVSTPRWVAWRAGGAVLLGATAAVILGLRPGVTGVLLGAGALVFSALGVRYRREPLVTISIVLVGLQYCYASRADGTAERIACSVVLAAVLYVVHSLAALAPVLERNAPVDPAVLRRFVERTLSLGGVGVCVAAMTALVASGGPTWKWFGVLGPILAVLLVGVGLSPLGLGSRRPRP